MPSTLSPASEWSVGAMCLLPVSAAEIGALVIAAGAGSTGWPILLAGGASATATMAFVTRAQMPLGAKVAQVVAVLLALMTLAVRSDPFGLHAVEAAVTAARVTAASASGGEGAGGGDATTKVDRSIVALRAGSGADDFEAALAASLTGVLPPDAPRVEGTIEQEATGGVTATALHWSLVRGGESRRCGTLRVTGTHRDLVIDRFRAAIVMAARASHGGALTCF